MVFDSIVDGGRDRKDRSDGALLRSQFPLAADVARALGLVVWPMTRFQADEGISTGAARYAADPSVEQVVICSTDKDFAQCVRGEQVVLFDRSKGKVTDEAGVVERFGVGPSRIPELFALIGDVSDGLPGIPGWGPKSAVALLLRYDSLEDVPEDLDDWDVEIRGKARLAATFRERYREVLLQRDLSVRRCDLPIRDEPADLEWMGADRALLTELVERIGVEGVMERVPRWR